jgi:hypothetical protein
MGAEERPLDEHEIEWAGENMDVLLEHTSEDAVRRSIMLLTFAAGLIAHVTASLISRAGVVGAPLLADLLYNLGSTLWTSVVLVFLLEVMVDRRRRFAQRYVGRVREALRQRGRTVPAPEPAPAGPEEQLALLRELKDEVAALRARLDATEG